MVVPQLQVFTLLDIVQCDNEDETDELMNNSGTEYMASEEIELTSNPDDGSVLTVEANVHVIEEAEIFCLLLITFLLVARYFLLLAHYNINKIKLFEIKLL